MLLARLDAPPTFSFFFDPGQLLRRKDLASRKQTGSRAFGREPCRIKRCDEGSINGCHVACPRLAGRHGRWSGEKKFSDNIRTHMYRL